MGIEAAGLQSGFVLAVVIAAFLLAGRLGGSEILALRAAQLALGVVLTMLVVSATAAVIGPLDPASARIRRRSFLLSSMRRPSSSASAVR